MKAISPVITHSDNSMPGCRRLVGTLLIAPVARQEGFLRS